MRPQNIENKFSCSINHMVDLCRGVFVAPCYPRTGICYLKIELASSIDLIPLSPGDRIHASAILHHQSSCFFEYEEYENEYLLASCGERRGTRL
jgi:hypothetical protein